MPPKEVVQDISSASPGEDNRRLSSPQQEGLGSCRLCVKMRLRIENEERARVKAQEQLARLQAENIRLRGGGTGGSASSSSRPTTPQVRNVSQETSAQSIGKRDSRGSPDVFTESAHNGDCSVDLDSVGRTLESYRREVTLLRASVREREELEARFEDRQRQLRVEHEQAQQEWESQVTGLICEVQDLEARNRQLERTTRVAIGASGATSTAASGTGGATSTAASGTGTRPTSSEAAISISLDEATGPVTVA